MLPRFEANILDDVGRVNPALEPRVEPEADHPDNAAIGLPFDQLSFSSRSGLWRPVYQFPVIA